MRVAIIGAGITGLTLAHELLKHDCTVTLYEAAPRAGGELGSWGLWSCWGAGELESWGAGEVGAGEVGAGELVSW